jgi:nitronate monooxygenase
VRTRFTELLGCRLPVQLAGMGWVSGPELASAVAAAGGAGTIAPHSLPPRLLEPLLDRLGPGVIGFNVLIPFLQIQAVEVAASRLRYVEFFYGEPDSALVALVHGHGALAAWQVGSVAEAEAAERAGCDFVIAQGIEAGGHVRGTTALLPLLDAVLDAITVPVVAAGGIATARGLAAVLRTLLVGTVGDSAESECPTVAVDEDGARLVGGVEGLGPRGCAPFRIRGIGSPPISRLAGSLLWSAQQRL